MRTCYNSTVYCITHIYHIEKKVETHPKAQRRSGRNGYYLVVIL